MDADFGRFTLSDVACGLWIFAILFACFMLSEDRNVFGQFSINLSVAIRSEGTASLRFQKCFRQIVIAICYFIATMTRKMVDFFLIKYYYWGRCGDSCPFNDFFFYEEGIIHSQHDHVVCISGIARSSQTVYGWWKWKSINSSTTPLKFPQT